MVVEVTVKTLDSNVFHFSVNEEMTVKEFKEHIAVTVGVTWDKQRIIFCGKVLQDDKKLQECDLNGKTVHLVQRLPPATGSQPGAGTSTSTNTGPQGHVHGPQQFRIPMDGANNIYVGAFTVPQETTGQDQIEHIVQQVISSMGDFGRGATVVSRSSPDGTNVNVHINIGQLGNQHEVHTRLLAVRAILRMAFNGINVLEGQPPDVYPVQNTHHSQTHDVSTPHRPPTTPTAEAVSDPPGTTSGSDKTKPTQTESTTTVAGEGSTETNSGSDTPPSTAPESEPLNTECGTSEPVGESADGTSQASSREDPPESGRPPRQPHRDSRRAFSFLTFREIHTTRVMLAQVYDEVEYLQERLHPYMTRYRLMLRERILTPETLNMEENRRLTNRVAEIVHAISHITHLLSDLDIDTREPNNLIVRSSLMPGIQAIPIRAEINVNSVAIPSDFAAGFNSAMAGLAAGHGPDGAAGPHGLHHHHVRTNAGNNNTAHPPRPHQHQHNFMAPMNHAELMRRATQFLTGAANAAMGVAQPPAPDAPAPSREETTASNTTTGTTHTPTTAGANMGFLRAPAPPPNPQGRGAGATAHTTSTTTNTGSRPSPMVADIYDPFLACESVFAIPNRSFARGSIRRGGAQRSSSVPAANRHRPRDGSPMAPGTSVPPGGNPMGVTENMFQMLFPGIGVINSMPLASFINWDSGSQDNDFLNELVAIIASNLTTNDFMGAFLQGDHHRFNGLRMPLTDFLNRRLLNNEPYSPEVLRVRVDELVARGAAEFANETREANVDPTIDLEATLSGFLNKMIFVIFRFILEYPEENADVFGTTLYELSSEMLIDTFSLLALCCTDGAESVERILVARVRELEHISAVVLSNRRAMRDNPTLRSFIVRKRVVDEQGGADEQAEESMDVDTEADRPQITVSRGLSARVRPAAGLGSDDGLTDEPPISHETALQALRVAVSDVTANGSGTSEAWLSTVPAGWGPIISRDLGAQGAPQRPLSDAYLCGMPSKRRRLMKSPSSPSQLANIPASIQQAIQRAGVRPRTSLDALNADLSRHSLSLQSSLQLQIRDSLAKRLSSDSDYDKQKFPNSGKIYKK